MKPRSTVQANEHKPTHEPPRDGTLTDTGDAIRNTDADWFSPTTNHDNLLELKPFGEEITVSLIFAMMDK